MNSTKHPPRRGSASALLRPFFLAFILVFSLAGCGRDEEPTPAPEPAAIVPTFTPTPGAENPGSPANPGSDAAQPVAVGAAITEPVTATAESGLPPAATAGPTATPAPPTPAPTATPIPDPAALLEAGREQQRIGNYGAAQTTFVQLLQLPGADARTRLHARFELARAYLSDAAYLEALAALDQLDAEAAAAGAAAGGASELLGKEHYLRGQALAGAGDFAGAIAAYWRFLESHPWMAEAVQQRIATAYLAAGDTEGAATALRRAAEGAGDAVARVRILEELARTYSNAARYGEAAGVYDEILAVAQNAGYRADMLYQAGQALSSAGDGAGAIERWRAAAAEAPASQSAYLALVELVNRNVEFDLYQRGYIDLQAGAYLPAVGAYTDYLGSTDATDARYAQAIHELGQSYLGAEDYANAVAQFDRVIAEFPQCPCFGQAWLGKARAQIASGDTAGGRQTYRTFARDFPGDPLAPEALWASGLRALRDGNEVEATIDFLALAESFPQSPRAPAALYAVGVGALQKGFHGQAAELYYRLQQEYPEYNWPGVSYWLGRAYQARGDEDLALAQWQTLVERAPDIYYGILAAQALKRLPGTNGAMLGNVAAVAGPPSRLAGDDGSQAFAEAWLAQWPAMSAATDPAEPNLGVLPADVAADIDLSKGRLLLELDQRADAVEALDRLFEKHKDDVRVLYPLSLEFERIGAFRNSVIAMTRLLEFSPAGLVENAPIFLQQRAYPLRFRELVAREAEAVGVDPFLYFSMIRQESLFEEGARSHAAAQGLAQIIPDTARWVAEQQGHPDWSNELIYRPYINVNFGAYYLDWVRDYLDGNLVSALVGYNAGPGNSEYWRELSGPDDALFVEVLGVNEPRLYVQLILGNLYHYTRLYGQP